MEQLVILLLIALISFINWLVKKSAEMREARKREKAADQGVESLPRRVPRLPCPKPNLRFPCAACARRWVCPRTLEPPALPKRVAARSKNQFRHRCRPRSLPAKPVISHVPVARAQVEPSHGEYRFIEMPRGFMKPAERQHRSRGEGVAHSGTARLVGRFARRCGALRNPGSAERPSRSRTSYSR